MDSVVLGSRCLVGDLVSIFDCDFHELNPVGRHISPGKISPVSIGDNVWLGSRVIVLKGVTIGDDTVVAAGAVVASSLPAGVLAAGVPAKILRTLAAAGA
ncbi:DapH/DapD/GlmU-related protein [Candidatus Laterigemmans baculatus]|uniref:DapH/DapD/GlmU-related protein n=1 Tax=Candidatus Laterigemmans baculatus TaxID=2770505 RepID=UPI0036F2D520